MLGRFQVPKARPQTHLVEDLPRFRRSPPPVVRVHPVMIPGFGQRPYLLQRENFAWGKSVLCAPAADSFSRPEE